MKVRIMIDLPEANETLLNDIKSLIDTRLENHTSELRPTMRIDRQEAYQVLRKKGGLE